MECVVLDYLCIYCCCNTHRNTHRNAHCNTHTATHEDLCIYCCCNAHRSSQRNTHRNAHCNTHTATHEGGVSCKMPLHLRIYSVHVFNNISDYTSCWHLEHPLYNIFFTTYSLLHLLYFAYDMSLVTTYITWHIQHKFLYSVSPLKHFPSLWSRSETVLQSSIFCRSFGFSLFRLHR